MNTHKRKFNFLTFKEAIDKLATLKSRTTGSCSVYHGRIGGVIQDTTILLMAPASLFSKQGVIKLEVGGKSIQKLATNLTTKVSASFISSIHISTEESLREVCKERGILVKSHFKKEIEELLLKIQQESGGNPLVGTLTKKLLKKTRTIKPNLMEYIHALLQSSDLGKRDKKFTINFFEALNIIRNKASHSDLSVGERERKKLIAGGFSSCVETLGDLKFGAHLYYFIAFNILIFFDSIGIKADVASRNIPHA